MRELCLRDSLMDAYTPMVAIEAWWRSRWLPRTLPHVTSVLENQRRTPRAERVPQFNHCCWRPTPQAPRYPEAYALRAASFGSLMPGLRAEADPPRCTRAFLVVRYLVADRMLWRVRERRGVTVENIELHGVLPTEAVHVFLVGLAALHQVNENTPELLLRNSVVNLPTRRGEIVGVLENAFPCSEVEERLIFSLPFVPAALLQRTRHGAKWSWREARLHRARGLMIAA